MKEIVFGKKSREFLKLGLDKVANAVKVTLGPRGKNVVIKEYGKSPVITKDGVSVARSITFKTEIEAASGELIKNAAIKTVESVGDSTTTSIVLTQAIFNEAYKINEDMGELNLSEVKKGIDNSVKKVIDYIKTTSHKISGFNDLMHIASISANNDKEIGSIIAEALTKVGNNGIVTIEKGKQNNTILKEIKGLQLTRGYLSHYFATNNETMECEMENVHILTIHDKLSNLNDIIHIIDKVAKENANLLIVGSNIDNDVIDILALNKIKNGLKVCVIKSPGYGENKHDVFEDFCYYVGSKLIDNIKQGISLSNLGFAKRVLIKNNSSIIIDGAGALVEERKETIKKILKSTENEEVKKSLQDRIDKLGTIACVIEVGGFTEVEQKELFDRYEDALCATQAALEEGFIPGGGITYLRASNLLNSKDGKTKSERFGISIIIESLKAPIKQILDNAGLNYKDIYCDILKNDNINYGYDVKNEKFVDMIEQGIIDPAKSMRVALENASSIAGTLLTTECAIYD